MLIVGIIIYAILHAAIPVFDVDFHCDSHPKNYNNLFLWIKPLPGD